MTCAKCGHKHWDNLKHCMYCLDSDEDGFVFCECGWIGREGRKVESE